MSKKFIKILNTLINIILLILIFHTFLLLYVIAKNFVLALSSVFFVSFFIFVIIFYIFLLVVNNNLKFNLILTIITIYISIYSVEWYLDTTGTTFKNKKELNLDYDIRSKDEVITELTKNNDKIYPGTYFFDLYQKFQSTEKNIYPFAGISNSKTISCNELGYWPIIKRDKYGFSNAYNFYGQDIDYLLIGDSFAEGWCVNEKDNLQNILIKNNKKTLSLGTSGSGPLLQLAILQEYEILLKPEKIIIMYYEGNDLKNLSEELNNTILLKYFNDRNYTQGLINKQRIIDKSIKKFIKNNYTYQINEVSTDLTYSSKIYRITKLSNIRLLLNMVSSKDIKSKNNKKNILIIEEYSKILNKIKIISNRLDAQLYFLYIPDWTRVKQGKLNKNNLNYKKDIIDLVNKNDIKIIDFSNKLKKIKNPLSVFPFEKHGHLSEKGYLILHEYIQEIINK